MMGTKNEPGNFDCYAKLDPDEPYFLLRGKDPVAPFLVLQWEASRRGAWTEVLEIAMAMTRSAQVQERASTDSYPKLAESVQCANAMRRWQGSRNFERERQRLDEQTIAEEPIS